MKRDRTSAIYLAAFIAGTGAIAAAATPAFDRPDLTAEDRARIAPIVEPTTDFTEAEAFEANPGGATTDQRFDRDAFSQPAANLAFAQQSDFAVGNGVFRKLWVSAPSSTRASDGLGPLFNARGCQECHIKDGRGHPPADGAGDAVSFLLALGYPDGEVGPYGIQLQDFAVNALPAEGRVEVTYTEEVIELAGGETAMLRTPHYTISDLAYGPIGGDTLIGPRVAPQMIGLGLLEAIHENDILAQADADDADGDGISGRPSWVTDLITGETVLGRFGWRASRPTVAQQSAAAFSNDMGLSNIWFPDGHGDCTAEQADCLAAPVGAAPGEVEVAQELFDLVVFYSSHLAVPGRRDYDDPEVLAGKELFYEAGCTACHTPKYVTSNDSSVPDALSRQLIWPYTDLLLHDMGDGLADRTVDGDVADREWRTPPLWGIGLTETVSGHTLLLHDGRARNLLEAVLWHGGEGEESRDAVIEMTPEERAALLRFLESL